MTFLLLDGKLNVCGGQNKKCDAFPVLKEDLQGRPHDVPLPCRGVDVQEAPVTMVATCESYAMFAFMDGKLLVCGDHPNTPGGKASLRPIPLPIAVRYVSCSAESAFAMGRDRDTGQQCWYGVGGRPYLGMGSGSALAKFAKMDHLQGFQVGDDG